MEEHLNKKDITNELLGLDEDINIDVDGFIEEGEENEESQIDPTTDNAIVNVLDLFIMTSPAILAKYGYPSPDLAIWKDWAKPNLNVAFNHFCPAGATENGAVSQPVIAGIIGVVAIGVAFLPVILKVMENRRAQKEEPELERAPDEPVVADPPTIKIDPRAEDPSEHVLTVAERVAQMEEQVV